MSMVVIDPSEGSRRLEDSMVVHDPSLVRTWRTGGEGLCIPRRNIERLDTSILKHSLTFTLSLRYVCFEF